MLVRLLLITFLALSMPFSSEAEAQGTQPTYYIYNGSTLQPVYGNEPPASTNWVIWVYQPGAPQTVPPNFAGPQPAGELFGNSSADVLNQLHYWQNAYQQCVQVNPPSSCGSFGNYGNYLGPIAVVSGNSQQSNNNSSQYQSQLQNILSLLHNFYIFQNAVRKILASEPGAVTPYDYSLFTEYSSTLEQVGENVDKLRQILLNINSYASSQIDAAFSTVNAELSNLSTEESQLQSALASVPSASNSQAAPATTSPSGMQAVSTIASTISNLVYPTDYAPQIAPQYRVLPPNFTEAGFSCTGGNVDGFIISILKDVAADYNTYQQRVANDVASYNRMISGPGGSLSENVTLLQNQLNTNVSGDESDYTDEVNTAKNEIGQHCSALAQHGAAKASHSSLSESYQSSKVVLRLQRAMPAGYKLTSASNRAGVQHYVWIRDVPLGKETIEIWIRPAVAMDANTAVSAVASTGRVVQGDAYTNYMTCNSTVHIISVGFHADNEQYAGEDDEFNIGQRHYSIFSSAPMDEAAPQDVATYVEHFCGI